MKRIAFVSMIALGVVLAGVCSTVVAGATPSNPAPFRFAVHVQVGGVRIGGLTAQQAIAKVRQKFVMPLVVVVDGKRFEFRAPRAATADIQAAVSRAKNAHANATLDLPVSVHGAALHEFADRLTQKFNKQPIAAKLTFVHNKPHVTGGQIGTHLAASPVVAGMAAALAQNSRAPVRFTTVKKNPKVTANSFGAVIVINRGLNRLTLYKGDKVWRVFSVATGQSVWPTPAGTFQIVVKWVNPTWYPPTNDSWAKGLKPVPPGPNNPLGTRWMGLSSPGIGIHGTDEPTSIGYSASHGCIRMQVADSEWLFTKVDIGTTVLIV